MSMTGIPDGFGVHSLHYSPVADVLVANVYTGSGANARFRIYVRRTSEETYSELNVDAGEGFSYRSVVISQVKPFMFMNMWSTASFGFDWQAVLKCDLSAMTVESVVTPDDLCEGLNRRWVADLVNVDDRVEKLFCSIASEIERSPDRTDVEYVLAALDLRTVAVESRTVLKGVFV